MNHEQDWIDRAISRDGTWEPPASFVDQVVAQAFATIPPHRQGARPSGVRYLLTLSRTYRQTG